METFMEVSFAMAFRSLQAEIHAAAKAHGFHENASNPLHVPTALALIGTEVSEAIEAHRRGKSEELGHEFADIVIRTMDLAESLGIDLAKAIVDKAAFNASRPYKHGGKLY